METLTRTIKEPRLPIKIIQFGEGNFLRAFIDWMIDLLNEKMDYQAGVAVIQPLNKGLVDILNKQDGLYHHVRQGLENGKTVDEIRKISCISEAINPYSHFDSFLDLAKSPDLQLIFSNTTEAGIQFDSKDFPDEGHIAKTFPGKLTQLLKARFEYFNGKAEKGVGIIPCELIEANGDKLKACIHEYIHIWNLGATFSDWVDHHCAFANTLVDRIVPGYPKDEIIELTNRIGIKDQLLVKSEAFHLFVIQAPELIRQYFPADKIGLNVKFVKDITPYRTQKVRILNGAHTTMVPVGLLNGIETVSETVDDEHTGKLIREIIFEEIVPTIHIPGENPEEFAREVISRFKNPYIRHELRSISLNSISKFKVRVLPTLLDYLELKNKLPARLVFSMACLIKWYAKHTDEVSDNPEVVSFFEKNKGNTAEKLSEAVLKNIAFWDQDLSKVVNLQHQVTLHLKALESETSHNLF